jgi:hypothetical protein
MRLLLVGVSLALLFMFSACNEDDNPAGPGDLDPNGEEALLAEFAADEAPGVVKVMTRNVYVGTDVDIVLGAEDVNDIPLLVAAAFQTLQETNFAERANTLAEEINKTKPHLIGLQEMAKVMRQSPGDFLIGNPVAASDTVLNFFTVLMNAIQAKGLNYKIAAYVKNADVELPMLTGLDNQGNPTFDDIRLLDHDVILVRGDVTYSDGFSKNYVANLPVDTTLGIYVDRGYTAITANIGGDSYRFVNTHLEAAAIEQLRLAQAAELVAYLAPETLPVILAGDFNSQAPSGPTYQFMIGQGYTDTWTKNTLTYNTNGYTFGHEADLRNSDPNFFERIDFIFLRSAVEPTWSTGFVIGDELRDRTSSNMWPSDHGGVAIKFQF